MYIDNRALLPFAAPFVMLFVFRVFWAASGLNWNPDGFGVVLGFVLSVGLGIAFAICLVEAKITLGGFWIGRKS